MLGIGFPSSVKKRYKTWKVNVSLNLVEMGYKIKRETEQ